MASTTFNFTFEPSVMEQVITELFAKSIQIILELRSPFLSLRNHNADPLISSSSSSFPSNFRRGDTWFNLTLRDFPAALEYFDLWRQSNLEPLVLDVILSPRKAVRNASCTSPGGIFVRSLSSGRDEFGSRHRNGKIVERWIVQYESQSISHPGRETYSQGSKEGSRGTYQSSEFQVMYRKAYSRIMVLLRSLYSAVRLLPAYKLIRDLNASGQVHPFSISHRLSSFAEPFSREEDAEMSQLDFGPLDIFFRKFTLSVIYLKKLEDVSSKPSTPLSSEFIMDYVGSPLANPVKRFTSLPIAGSAPSYATFSRQHSWCNDHVETTSPCPTPSHTYSYFRALDLKLNPGHHPRHHLVENFASSCSVTCVSSSVRTKKNDEWWPSPPFSPVSSSPSTPTHLYGALSRSESAPVITPVFRHKGSDGGQNQCLYASSSSKNERQSYPSEVDTLGIQASTTSAQPFLTENKLQLKKESLRLEFKTDMLLSKRASTGKDSAGHIIGLKTPSYTPPPIQSRSSSRLPFLDEFEDSDFICHFAEADQAKNTCRVKSSNNKDNAGDTLCPGELTTIERSTDAAVGALVWMLKCAPPLRLDKDSTFRSMQVFKDKASSQKMQLGKLASNKEDDLLKIDSSLCLDITTSELFKQRTVADAFKEFRAYKGIREMILKKNGSLVQSVEHDAKSNT